jgi:hypothetical protein
LHPVEQINELVQAVTAAEACFEIWRLLTFKNIDVDTAAHSKAFGAYRQFFISSVHAHFVASVMALCRLFDSDPGVVSLSSCNDLRLKLTSAQNAAFRRKLGIALKIANRLAGVRNQLFGHRADIAIKRVFDKAKLKRDELRCLIRPSSRAG